MRESQSPSPDEVDHLLHNARLRDELEPYLDESMSLVDIHRMPTPQENEFLESLLAWERAPVLPISEWFTPALTLPAPDTLDNDALHAVLWDMINKLYDRRIVLDFTDHLTDRQLYCLIYRDILPASEKKVDLPKNYLHWHCLDSDEDQETWLRYYASQRERDEWAAENRLPLPPTETPPHPRRMPRRLQ